MSPKWEVLYIKWTGFLRRIQIWNPFLHRCFMYSTYYSQRDENEIIQLYPNVIYVISKWSQFNGEFRYAIGILSFPFMDDNHKRKLNFQKKKSNWAHFQRESRSENIMLVSFNMHINRLYDSPGIEILFWIIRGLIEVWRSIYSYNCTLLMESHK